MEMPRRQPKRWATLKKIVLIWSCKIRIFLSKAILMRSNLSRITADRLHLNSWEFWTYTEKPESICRKMNQNKRSLKKCFLSQKAKSIVWTSFNPKKRKSNSKRTPFTGILMWVSVRFYIKIATLSLISRLVNMFESTDLMMVVVWLFDDKTEMISLWALAKMTLLSKPVFVFKYSHKMSSLPKLTKLIGQLIPKLGACQLLPSSTLLYHQSLVPNILSLKSKKRKNSWKSSKKKQPMS